MDYWKTKVLPKIKKVLDTSGPKKAAAAEACKIFDDSKEAYSKELEDKKTEFQPKVIEIYEASSAEIKALIKEPKASGLKKYASAVQKLLDQLNKIEFPGSKTVCEATSKFGPALVSGPVFFVFEKVSTFLVSEEKAVESPPETSAAAEETTTKEKEIVVEVEKKEEVVAEAEAAATDPPKVEEPVVAAEPPKP
ncbi:Plasma membrane-associated cation-binding protein [Actinidia chinensis var. chinensis]|uniref:Plasma membrane-associated cation-binding protein n=1 Tax=Actinidia chinensis var. chinensis TaxID=1590841 RepID=A0A2R6QMC3_ACTCC|nr:Plasma membrane-associated cation-binding protein [Actinidia chinensis var. chinensis]